jgi:hypothetical protein
MRSSHLKIGGAYHIGVILPSEKIDPLSNPPKMERTLK